MNHLVPGRSLSEASYEHILRSDSCHILLRKLQDIADEYYSRVLVVVGVSAGDVARPEVVGAAS